MTHPKQNASILLVENDAVLRNEIRRHLQERGYDAVCAASQAEAEAWIGKQPFDLLITDLILEFSDSGFIICHHFRKAYPASRAILLSDVAAKNGMQFPAKTHATGFTRTPSWTRRSAWNNWTVCCHIFYLKPEKYHG